ncbi:hypothetical protein Tco_0223945 [Tanacetum coccineum]
MADSSSYKPSSPEITPKEEPVTLDKPKRPNPFLPADQNTLKEAFIRALTQYKEYLIEVWYSAKTLDDSMIWVSTPTGGIRGDIVGRLRKMELSKRVVFLLGGGY